MKNKIIIVFMAGFLAGSHLFASDAYYDPGNWAAYANIAMVKEY